MIEREKGLKAKYEHNMRKKAKKLKYNTKTRKNAKKQPCLWKDLQKMDFKNSKEMLYTFFLMTRFN